MPKIESVVFHEAVTVNKQPLSSAGQPKFAFVEDAIGVTVSWPNAQGAAVRVPWGNVKFATYAAEKAKP